MSDETLIPTLRFRYVKRLFAISYPNENIAEYKPVLQQRFDKPSGGHVWRDVETVSYEDAAND